MSDEAKICAYSESWERDEMAMWCWGCCAYVGSVSCACTIYLRNRPVQSGDDVGVVQDTAGGSSDTGGVTP